MRSILLLGLLFWGGVVCHLDFRQRVNVISFSNRAHGDPDVVPVSEGGREVEKPFLVDDNFGVGRLFDGIGAISGGGATSKLLVSYKDPHRSNILDYLFKPGFGASLQILKVEIGGDSQSSDGSESSHMHSADDQNYNRGYEWWLMKEAKKRNPDIKLYGLPWTFPGWVGGGVLNPFINRTATAYYFINWINGAKREHNLTIDYIGIWNERDCDPTFVKLFRRLLNEQGHSHIQLVVPDAMDWTIVDKLIADPDFLEAIDIIGQHYPGASSPDSARKLGKKLWGSEEYSTGNGLSGGGCWARVLNESPVNAQLTSFIAWNMIASYYDGFPYTEDGLMSAQEPWSGHYVVSSPIWMSAHHTQFYHPGWSYLLPYHGLGTLNGNGTYIALTSPDRQHLTIVIETMDPHRSGCSYPMPYFSVAEEQSVSLKLSGSFKHIEQLNVWFSHLDFTGGSGTVLFQKMAPITIVDGMIKMQLKSNEIYTLTTMTTGLKGDHGKPPESQPFPKVYSDDFEKYEIGEEPDFLSQQSGAFEVSDSGDVEHGKVMTQVVTMPPVDTCRPTIFVRPANVFGDPRWKNVRVGIDVYLDKNSPESATGVYLGSQTPGAGCYTIWNKGIYYWVSVKSHMARITSSQDNDTIIYMEAPLLSLDYGRWFNMILDVQNNTVMAYLDHQLIMKVNIPKLPSSHGFLILGPETFGVAHFDNLSIERTEVASETEWGADMEKQKNLRRAPFPKRRH